MLNALYISWIALVFSAITGILTLYKAIKYAATYFQVSFWTEVSQPSLVISGFGQRGEFWCVSNAKLYKLTRSVALCIPTDLSSSIHSTALNSIQPNSIIQWPASNSITLDRLVLPWIDSS